MVTSMSRCGRCGEAGWWGGGAGSGSVGSGVRGGRGAGSLVAAGGSGSGLSGPGGTGSRRAGCFGLAGGGPSRPGGAGLAGCLSASNFGRSEPPAGGRSDRPTVSLRSGGGVTARSQASLAPQSMQWSSVGYTRAPHFAHLGSPPVRSTPPRCSSAGGGGGGAAGETGLSGVGRACEIASRSAPLHPIRRRDRRISSSDMPSARAASTYSRPAASRSLPMALHFPIRNCVPRISWRWRLRTTCCDR